MVSQILAGIQVHAEEDGRRCSTKLSPKLVVGDEEFASVSLAIQKGIEHALISDELQLGFAKSAIAKRVEACASRWYADFQRKVSHLLVPSFGTDSGNIHYMTPVTREVTKSREATRAEHGLPLDSCWSSSVRAGAE